MDINQKWSFGSNCVEKGRAWNVVWVAILAFAAGSLATSYFGRLRQVRADNNRIFELSVYHAVPGKVPALEARFREASKLQAKHNLNIIGYWVPNDDPKWADTFIYIVAAPNRKELETNWQEFHADPAFQEYVKSEQAEKLIERVDSTYMRATEFSALR